MGGEEALFGSDDECGNGRCESAAIDKSEFEKKK